MEIIGGKGTYQIKIQKAFQPLKKKGNKMGLIFNRFLLQIV